MTPHEQRLGCYDGCEHADVDMHFYRKSSYSITSICTHSRDISRQYIRHWLDFGFRLAAIFLNVVWIGRGRHLHKHKRSSIRTA